MLKCGIVHQGKLLFLDVIEAWVHGPVVLTLYQKYKSYGWQKIPQVKFDERRLSNTILEVLDAVYNIYGNFSGEQLEALTHSETPWQKACGSKLKPYEICTNPIAWEDIKEFYLKLYQDAQND